MNPALQLNFFAHVHFVVLKLLRVYYNSSIWGQVEIFI